VYRQGTFCRCILRVAEVQPEPGQSSTLSSTNAELIGRRGRVEDSGVLLKMEVGIRKGP